MRLTVKVNTHEEPRNAALLMFTENPEQWFPGARIEVAQFSGGARGNTIEERVFRGPLPEQIRECLNYLRNLSVSHLQKVPSAPEAQGWVSYPISALEESIVNAVYHRGYDGITEPVKIYLYPDRMEITSYPGPAPGIELRHLLSGGRVPPVPARNRRIGEFLKELRLAEGRGTGIPKVFDAMAQNGSPPPQYEFDEQRTYFTVILQAHPEYLAVSALRDSAHLEAVGDREGALRRLEQAQAAQPASGPIASRLIEIYAKRGELPKARAVYQEFIQRPDKRFPGRVTLAFASALIEAHKSEEGLQISEEGLQILDSIPGVVAQDEAVEAAILERRANREEQAHALFQKAGEAILRDARALHEFAQSKIKLSTAAYLRGKKDILQKTASKRLLLEAKEMLQRVIQLDTANQRRAWAWYDLGRVSQWLGEPKTNAEQAFQKARELAGGDAFLLDRLDKQL